MKSTISLWGWGRQMYNAHGKGAIYRDNLNSPCFYAVVENPEMESAHRSLVNSYDPDREIVMIMAKGQGSTSFLMIKSEAEKIQIEVNKYTFNKLRVLR